MGQILAAEDHGSLIKVGFYCSIPFIAFDKCGASDIKLS